MKDYILCSSLHTVKVSLSRFIACLSTKYTEQAGEREWLWYDEANMSLSLTFIIYLQHFFCLRVWVYVKVCVCALEEESGRQKESESGKKTKNEYFWIPRSRGVCRAQCLVHMQYVCITAKSTVDTLIGTFGAGAGCWNVYYIQMCVCVCMCAVRVSLYEWVYHVKCAIFFPIQIFYQTNFIEHYNAEDIYTT